MTFNAEQLKAQLPYYLTAEPAQKELVRNLDALNRGAKTVYYISEARGVGGDGILQGDGWWDFQLYSFDTGKTCRKEHRNFELVRHF